MEHFPCFSSPLDMAKVKTEVEDSEQDVGALTENVQVKVACNMLNLVNIKTEVKSEPSDFIHEATDTNTALTDVTYSQVGLINQRYGSAPPYRGRGKRGKVRGSRGRGRGRGSVQQMPKILSIAPKAVSLQMPSGSFMGGSTLPNILPKVTSDNKSHEETGLKIDSVFYTRPFKRKIIKVANTTQANGVFSVDSRNATCSPSTAGTKPTVAVRNTFTFNSEVPSLTGQKISTLPFSPFILGDNIQQDPQILGASGPLVNPGQSVGTLQPPSFVPGLQAINLPQPLANMQNLKNLSMPLNQNTALGVQQNIPQVFNAGTQNSSVYTSNTNQAVGSIMASGVSPTQQMTYAVPVLVGNQIVLMDLPVQYQTGVQLGNVPTFMGLSSLIQSPIPFSSTATSAAITQHSMASSISPSQSGNSVSVDSVYPVLTTAPQSSIVHQQSCPPPLTANTSNAQENAISLKAAPPLLLVVSSSSSSQTVSPACSANFKREIYSGTAATNSSTFELSSSLNQTTITQTEKPSNLPGSVTAHSLHNKELSSGSSEFIAVSGDKSDSIVDQKVSETLTYTISNSKPITVKSEIAQPVITPSDHQSVMSTGACSGTLVTAGIPLFNSSGINVQNILPHPSVASIIQQPLISHFQTNDSSQHNSISVFNNNTGNIGSTPGFFFHNGLSMQRLDYAVQKYPGQNIWIQNITDDQPVNAGCGNNNQQIFVNSPVHETVESSQAITVISSPPLCVNKFDIPPKTSLLRKKLPANGKLLKKNTWSIKMATPDTIGKSLIEKVGKSYYSVVNIFDPSQDVASLPKTVREMLETKVRTNPVISSTKSLTTKSSTSTTTMNQSTHTLRQYKQIRPNDQILKTQSRSVEVSKGSGDKSNSMQPLTNLFDTKTGLLKKHPAPTQCDNDFTDAFMNNSDVSQPNEEVICKIMDVKSMADVAPKPVADHSVFLNANKLSDGKGTKGTLFVGPLTKEQLDRIIQNPSELEKYVSVPSGHILSTKALVVPAASNSVITKGPQSKRSSVETIHYSPISLKPCLGKSEPSFIKIHPKSTVQTVESPSHSVTTNTSNNTVTSFQQNSASTNDVTLSSLQNTYVNNVITAPFISAAQPETIDVAVVKSVSEQTSQSTSGTRTSCSVGTRKRKFVSEQRRQELKCYKEEQNQNGNMMKLSFVGDLALLKDALRRTTVQLENLDTDCETGVVAAHHSPRQIVKESLQRTGLSTCGDNYKQKLGKRKLLKLEQQKVSWTRHKETKIDRPAQRQWIPVEVVGDLAIRGKMSDCQTASCGNRRSNRISAKPRLDYADLERLPFRDLDIEIENPEYDFESFSPPQSPSPPVLSPAVEHMESHSASLFSSSHSPVGTTESLNLVTEYSAAPVLTSQSITSRDCISPSQLTDCYYSSESESDMYDPCGQTLSKADKKKIMWKRHNEITMFLVKHAGKFHSDDESNEHYCNICHKYKTNGIFCLSHHLKRHLSGSLKCLECAYEACHEENLAEHCKTLHSL